MTYTLKANHAYYGDRTVPFSLLAKTEGPESAGIPLAIESAGDLDLDAIARELDVTVYGRGAGHWRNRKTPAETWGLTVEGTTPEKARELNAMLDADGLTGYRFKATIVVSGYGISLIYEREECERCGCALEWNYHCDGICGDCHDATARETLTPSN